MDPSLIEAVIFKTVSFAACLAIALFVFTRAILEKVEKAPEPDVPVVNPISPPIPEKHGGIMCEGCDKDDPDRKAFVNEGCNHVLCELCVRIVRRVTIRKLELCPDLVYRARLQDMACKVCSYNNGYVVPYTSPIIRTPPKISDVPNLYR